MKRPTHCGSPEHAVSRRAFLHGAIGVGGAALGFGSLVQPGAAAELARQQKRVLLVWLAGGVSQLETWDPKPGTSTGGPFQAIPTAVPGTHICELLPYTAQIMQHLALIRGININENDHGKGAYIMHTGRRQEPARQYPHLGSICSKLLTDADNPLPGYIHVTPKGNGAVSKEDAAFLGPRHASLALSDGQTPANITLPGGITLETERQRQELRGLLNDRFTKARRTAETEAYTGSYEQAAQLMARKHIFDLSREPETTLERYGKHDFGRHCLTARRLLEGGATFVKVTHTNYDTHHENFDFHIEQLGAFDRPFATLVNDLKERGMLETTLIIVMSEFGRTPTINRNLGRDHWGTAWSIAVGGCGIKGGAVVGKTNDKGTAVTDRMVNGGHLFHTYFRALGLNSKKNWYINEQPIPMCDPNAEPIAELLA